MNRTTGIKLFTPVTQEPFLQHGSENDDVNIAIIQLINLAINNPKLAAEACEFIAACVKDSAPDGCGYDRLSVPYPY